MSILVKILVNLTSLMIFLQNCETSNYIYFIPMPTTNYKQMVGNKLRRNPLLNCKTDPTKDETTLKGREFTIHDLYSGIPRPLGLGNQMYQKKMR
ncbi:hypothetical protein Hanom_Chr16g01494241 [Helianthus anomalus]